VRAKIRTKIIAICAFVIVASLLSSGYFTYAYVTDILRERSLNDSRTQLAQISSQLVRVREQVVKLAEYIVSDEEINARIMPMPSSSIEDDYFRMTEVQDRLKRFAALNAFILNAMIVREDGTTFSNNSGYADYFADYLREDWFQAFLDSGARTGFTAPHDFFYLNGNRDVFSYAVKYRNLQEPRSPEYWLVLDIQYSEIANAFEQSLSDFEQLMLFNEAGEMLFSGGAAPDASYEPMIARAIESGGLAEDDSHMYLALASEPYGWHQGAVLSKAKLFEPINRLLDYYVFIIISSLVAMLAVVLPLIVNITKPISRLTQAMKRVSVGDLTTNVTIRSGDELEVLGSGFNRMVSDLKQHVEASIQHEELKRTMQISLLMSQINPHFIYNTLNTVIYLSYANRSRDAAVMTEAFIGILQDTIKTGDGVFFAALGEEMVIVEKYIAIQQFRYPDRFRVEWEVEEELRSAVIPRLVLQPLVENAIFHGIVPMEEPEGRIRIAARREGGELILLVEDDGVGLEESSPETGAPDRSGKRADQMRGIGLANIRERIRFHYGEPYGVAVENGAARGVRAVVRLPYRSQQ